MFLYYLPDRLTISLEELRAVGLGYAFDAPGWTFGKAPKGPDGKEGMLVGYCGGNERLLGYKPPDEQTWRGVPGTPAMVGMYTADPPSPKSLVRPSALPGRSLELGDGREWLVPVVRTWRGDEESAAWVLELPTAAGLDDEGNWTASEVVAKYAHLYKAAVRWYELKQALIAELARAQADDDDADGDEGPDDETTLRAEMDVPELFDLALQMLAANYRLGKVEAVMLGLLSTDTAQAILDEAIDWGTVTEFVRKKKPADRAGVA